MFDQILLALASSAVVGFGVWWLMRRSQTSTTPPPAIIQSVEHTFDSAVNAVIDHVTASVPRQRLVIAAAERQIQSDLARAKDLVARLQSHIDANGGH